MTEWTTAENAYFLKLCYGNTPHQLNDCDVQFINFIPVAYEMEMKFNVHRSKQECFQHFMALSKLGNPLKNVITESLNEIQMPTTSHVTQSKVTNNANNEQKQEESNSKKNGYTITAGDEIWWYNPHKNANNKIFRSSIITSISKAPSERDDNSPVCIKYWPKYSRVKPKWKDKIKLKWGDDSSFKFKDCNFVVSECAIVVPDVLKPFDNISKAQLNFLYKYYVKQEDNQQPFALELQMSSTRHELKAFQIEYNSTNVNLMSTYFSLTDGLKEFDMIEIQRSMANGTLQLHKELNLPQSLS